MSNNKTKKRPGLYRERVGVKGRGGEGEWERPDEGYVGKRRCKEMEEMGRDWQAQTQTAVLKYLVACVP